MRNYTGLVPDPTQMTLPSGKVTWQSRYVDPSGKQRAINRPTKAAALRQVDSVRKQLASGGNPALGRRSFKQYADEFVAMIEADPAKVRRQRAMLSNLRIHIIPRWGKMPLNAVTTKEIERWIGELAQSHLKPSSVRNVYATLSSFMTWAMREGYLAATPCRGKVPTMPPLAKRVFPLDDENVRIVHQAMPPRYRMMVRVAAEACLRSGEVRGLRWGDIDHLHNRLVIRQQLLSGGDKGEAVFAPPKARIEEHEPEHVQVHPDLILALVEYRSEFFIANPWDLVFVTERGNPVGRDNLRRMWDLARVRAGCPAARFHDLRHYGVSKMLANPLVPIAEAAAQARHRDGGVLMMKAYAHVLGDDRARSAAALAGTWN